MRKNAGVLSKPSYASIEYRNRLLIQKNQYNEDNLPVYLPIWNLT